MLVVCFGFAAASTQQNIIAPIHITRPFNAWLKQQIRYLNSSDYQVATRISRLDLSKSHVYPVTVGIYLADLGAYAPWKLASFVLT